MIVYRYGIYYNDEKQPTIQSEQTTSQTGSASLRNQLPQGHHEYPFFQTDQGRVPLSHYINQRPNKNNPLQQQQIPYFEYFIPHSAN